MPRRSTVPPSVCRCSPPLHTSSVDQRFSALRLQGIEVSPGAHRRAFDHGASEFDRRRVAVLADVMEYHRRTHVDGVLSWDKKIAIAIGIGAPNAMAVGINAPDVGFGTKVASVKPAKVVRFPGIFEKFGKLRQEAAVDERPEPTADGGFGVWSTLLQPSNGPQMLAACLSEIGALRQVSEPGHAILHAAESIISRTADAF